jgi:hypothetical protein
MQGLQQELWALEGPRVLTHVGDLAWWATMHLGREQEWKRHVWLDGDRCVAWAWLRRPSSLDYEVHPDHSRGPVHEEILSWFESEADGSGPLSTLALEGDRDRLDVLADRAYSRPDDYKSYVYNVVELGDEMAPPGLPPGHALRTVEAGRDLRERVEVHREVWAPSRVTEERYRNVMRAWRIAPISTASSRRRRGRSPDTRSAGTTRRTGSRSSNRSGRIQHIVVRVSEPRSAVLRSSGCGTPVHDMRLCTRVAVRTPHLRGSST